MNSFIQLLLSSLYFFLPAYFGNMAPVIFQKIKFLEKPIWEAKLGKNKTWRGMVSGTVLGGLVFFIQKILYNTGFTSLAIIDYSDFSILLGLLLGLGAVVGDAVESYYKRKAEIPSGESWPVFDQLDFVIGALVFSWFVYVPNAEVALLILIFSPLLHVLVNQIAYVLEIRDTRW